MPSSGWIGVVVVWDKCANLQASRNDLSEEGSDRPVIFPHKSIWISDGNIQHEVTLSPRRIAKVDLRDDPALTGRLGRDA